MGCLRVLETIDMASGTNPRKVCHVADTSFFVACGHPENGKYKSLRDHAQAEGIVIKIPPKVQEEMSSDSDGYTSGNISLQTAVQQGWLDIRAVQYTMGEVSGTMDETRRRMANQTGRPDHHVEKADTEVIGLAVQLLATGEAHRVRLYTGDKAMSIGGSEAIKSQSFQNQFEVIDVQEFRDTTNFGRILK